MTPSRHFYLKDLVENVSQDLYTIGGHGSSMGLDAIEGCQECADCGFFDLSHMHYIDLEHKWVCFDCYIENYMPCGDCKKNMCTSASHQVENSNRRVCPSCGQARDYMKQLLDDRIYTYYVVPILNKRYLTAVHLLDQMNKKVAELKGLISNEGALYIISKELDIPIEPRRYFDIVPKSPSKIDSRDAILDRIRSIDDIVKRLGT